VPSQPSKNLVAVDNPHPGRDYEIRCETSELTCLCPMTGQPDFATVMLTYVPDALIVELKSLKLYLWSYRDEGAFHEDITNRILDDLVAAIAPRRMTVETAWNVRGGITTTVRARWRVSGARCAPRDRAAVPPKGAAPAPWWPTGRRACRDG
jgi:7-cyano-7-deazaguanine reductase